ncbi:uncharacterized protein [Ptychodera flava]|uniref:uncharacterized protein isoform X2 n=1 Tax=Ptychodera flava TaxID=63121 RepID=UPI00396A1BEF
MANNFMRLFLAVVISFMALKSPLVNSDDKTGICPDVISEGPYFVAECVEPCINDSDCLGRQKCCSYSCGNTCREPHPQPESSEFPCVDITIPECQEVLPYNMTSNSQDQGDVRNRLLHILNSNHSCSHELIFMACAWNLPKCVTFSSSQIALPCRSLCEKLNSTCRDNTDREEFVRSLTNGVGCGTLPDIPTSEHHDLCQDYSQLIKPVENETSSSVILLSASQSEHIYAPSTSQLSIQDTMLSSPDANSIRIYPTPSISADTMATEGTGSLQATSGLNPTGGVPTSSAIPVATSTVNEVSTTAFMTSIGNIHSSTFRINPTPSISASTMATKGIGQSLQATSGLNPTGSVPTSSAVPIARSAVNEVSTSAFRTSIGNLHSSVSATEKASILPSPSVTLRSSSWKQSSYFPDDNVISSVVPELSSSITDTSVPSSAEPQFSSSALINPSQSVKPVEATPSLTSALLGSSTVYTSTDIGSSLENLGQSSTSVEFTPTNSSPIRNSVSVQFPPPPPPIPPFTLRSTSSLPSVSPVLASSSEQAPMQSSLSGVQTHLLNRMPFCRHHLAL